MGGCIRLAHLLRGVHQLFAAVRDGVCRIVAWMRRCAPFVPIEYICDENLLHVPSGGSCVVGSLQCGEGGGRIYSLGICDPITKINEYPLTDTIHLRGV